jgi:hypothetical protein
MPTAILKTSLLWVLISRVSSNIVVCSVGDEVAHWQLRRDAIIKGKPSNLIAFRNVIRADKYMKESNDMIQCCKSNSCSVKQLQQHFAVLTTPVQGTSRVESMELALDLFLDLTKSSNDPSVMIKRYLVTKAKEMMRDHPIRGDDRKLFYQQMVPVILQAKAQDS